MLSPGEWHRSVPRGVDENLQFRIALRKRAQSKPGFQKSLIEMCRQDLLFYVNGFVFTYDPRTRLKSLPFVTWPIQDRAFPTILDCIEHGQDLVIEKSRDMGASWMSLIVMEWLWHFHPGNSFLMVSRKEDLVDAPGDPDSLFWKVDFVHKHLPRWLKPETDRRKLHFGNMGNGSTIDGESTTAAAGVGGRRTAMFIDEFSRIEEGYHLLAGTADTTQCRIFNFTPWGTSNAAYKLARRDDVRKLRLHWKDHPEKARGLYQYDERQAKVVVLDHAFSHGPEFNFVLDGKLRSPWYDAECKRRNNDREVAQMLDIDYQGSAYQFFDKAMIVTLQATYGEDPWWEGDITFDPDTGRPRSLVKAKGGPLKLWCHLVDDKPVPGRYGAGADLSAGTGATNSCLSIASARTGEKVAEYASPYLRPEQMALRAVALCWLFKDDLGNGAAFAWEQQGPGIVFGKRMIELGYRNIFYRKNELKMGGPQSMDVPGWFPSNDNKRLLLEEYREALSSRKYLNRNSTALEECLFFIHTPQGKVEHSQEEHGFSDVTGERDPSGARVNHGDRVIADSLSWMMIREELGGVVKKKKEEGPPVLSLAWRREYSKNRKREDEERVWL